MCPSEVLPLELKQNKQSMEDVRAAARALAAQGKIVIMQKGRKIDPDRIHGPIRLKLPGSYQPPRDMRAHPEDYRIGVGEKGVLTLEPYKSEILPHWKFKTPRDARYSAQKIYEMFLAYQGNQDFVGMDMARKFIQMGGTRSRRYANHPSGRKYSTSGEILPLANDPEKAASAEIFFRYLKRIDGSQPYADLKLFWREAFG